MTIKTHGRMVTDNSISISQLAITDGTDNQALVTDGSGTMRFATVGIGASVGSSTYVEDIRTGDGTITKFTNSNAGTLQNGFSVSAAVEESVFVYVDGVAQPTSAYTLSSSGSGVGAGGNLDEITISPALVTGQQLRICHLGINTAIANNSITGAKIAMGADVAGDIIYYNGTDYQRLGIGTAAQHLATNTGATAPEWVTDTDDGKLKISSNDTTPDYLVTKLTAGDGITLTETTQGGNETLDIDVTDATVDSAMLKTTTQELSVTFSGSAQTMKFTSVGAYGFWPQFKTNSTATYFDYSGNPGFQMSTTYQSLVIVQTHISPMTAYVRHRYVQASPPYNLGDGDVNGFIFALIHNGTGEIKRMSISQDPPWSYHEVHGINPENVFRDKMSRKKMVTRRKKVDLTKVSTMEEFLVIPEDEIVEYSNDIKMEAMNKIPHPFSEVVFIKEVDGKPVEDTDYMNHHHVALIDPMSSVVERLDTMKNDGDESISLFHDGYLKIDNVDITNRKRPEGVQVYQAKWR